MTAHEPQFADAADRNEASTTRTAVDELEPADELAIDPAVWEKIYPVAMKQAYREAAQRLLPIFNDGMLMILSNNFSPQSFWEVCFGAGLPLCEGRSMTELAVSLGLERQTISKGAKKYQRTAGLPVNQYLKPVTAIPGFANARRDQFA